MLNYRPSAFWLENDPGIQFAFADGGSPLTADYAAIVPVFTKHHLMFPRSSRHEQRREKGVLVKLFLCIPR
jgi:hypothetical protein